MWRNIFRCSSELSSVARSTSSCVKLSHAQFALVRKNFYSAGVKSENPALTTSLKEPLSKAKSAPPPPPPKQSKFKQLLVVFASGAVAYFAISYALDNFSSKSDPDSINFNSKNLPGKIVPSRVIRHGKNPGDIKITLYQYVTCPFCCKVRAYLDYYGYSYDIVEVNSVYKSQLDWSSYKKVPTVAIQVPSKENPEKYELDDIVQLNDSSVIISALETFRLDPKTPLKQIITYFEPLKIMNEEPTDKKKGKEYINKYFVMLHNDKSADGKSNSDRRLEREWRGWVDSKFIHAISPNVYRTMGEALDAFNWFDEIGDWKQNFNYFERLTVIYTGAVIMYLIGKNLKRKHNLKEDVRQSLYEYCNEWVSTLNSDQQFRGGSSPNLSDLALYGAIGSFYGTISFDDMMNNSNIKKWYDACKEQVETSKGSFYLNDPVKTVVPDKNDTKKDDAAKKPKKLGIF